MTSPLPRQAGKLGRLPHDPDRPVLVADEFLDSNAEATPAQALVDWLTLVTDWPMYSNDKLGCCVWSACGHMIEAWTRYATGTTTEVATQDLLTGYSAVTGFDPNATQPDGTNPTDNGTVIADALDYWLKTGIAGHKILAYGQIKDPSKIDAALNMFGALMIGVNFPQSAMDQFNADQPWTVVRNSPIEGGHAVHVGYDGAAYKAVTWAKVQEISFGWWTTYTEEVWFVITPEWIEANGLTPSGLNLQALGDDYSKLTGKPNPFQAPTPPNPAPAGTSDRDFAQVLRPWVNHFHYGETALVAAAGRKWLADKNL